MIENIRIMEELVEGNWANGFDEVLPDVRFFEPTSELWPILKKVMQEQGIKMLIDCGAGSGHVQREAMNEGIKMAACDIHRRTCHVGVEVQIMPAHRMPFDREIWPIVCRPDHSGWCAALWQRALLKDSGFIYCGKREAMTGDVVEDYPPDEFFYEVGQENEIMAVWHPIPELAEYVKNEIGFELER